MHLHRSLNKPWLKSGMPPQQSSIHYLSPAGTVYVQMNWNRIHPFLMYIAVWQRSMRIFIIISVKVTPLYLEGKCIEVEQNAYFLKVDAYESIHEFSKNKKGSMMLLIITLELSTILHNIGRTDEGNVMRIISPSNTFLTLLLPARFHKKMSGCFWPL